MNINQPMKFIKGRYLDCAKRAKNGLTLVKREKKAIR